MIPKKYIGIVTAIVIAIVSLGFMTTEQGDKVIEAFKSFTEKTLTGSTSTGVIQ